MHTSKHALCTRAHVHEVQTCKSTTTMSEGILFKTRDHNLQHRIPQLTKFPKI